MQGPANVLHCTNLVQSRTIGDNARPLFFLVRILRKKYNREQLAAIVADCLRFANREQLAAIVLACTKLAETKQNARIAYGTKKARGGLA